MLWLFWWVICSCADVIKTSCPHDCTNLLEDYCRLHVQLKETVVNYVCRLFILLPPDLVRVCSFLGCSRCFFRRFFLSLLHRSLRVRCLWIVRGIIRTDGLWRTKLLIVVLLRAGLVGLGILVPWALLIGWRITLTVLRRWRQVVSSIWHHVVRMMRIRSLVGLAGRVFD
jgi:hypothetical protein